MLYAARSQLAALSCLLRAVHESDPIANKRQEMRAVESSPPSPAPCRGACRPSVALSCVSPRPSLRAGGAAPSRTGTRSRWTWQMFPVLGGEREERGGYARPATRRPRSHARSSGRGGRARGRAALPRQAATSAAACSGVVPAQARWRPVGVANAGGARDDREAVRRGRRRGAHRRAVTRADRAG